MTPPIQDFLWELFPRQTAKNYPLSLENGSTHEAPFNVEWGGGGRMIL